MKPMKMRGCVVVLDAAAPSAEPRAPDASLADEAGARYQALSLEMAARLLTAEAPASAPAAVVPRSNGRVLCAIRVRPLLEAERDTLGFRLEGRTHTSFAQFEYDSIIAEPARRRIHVLSEARRLGKPTGALASESFKADEVFDSSDDHSAVFDGAVRPLVERVLRGDGSSTVISFGQTGAGKTTSTLAMQALAVGALLEGGATELSISFYEIYGERVVDLLSSAGSPLEVRDGGHGEQSRVCGLSEVRAESKAAAELLLAAANALRATSCTARNAQSSRSHAICVLRPLFCREPAAALPAHVPTAHPAHAPASHPVHAPTAAPTASTPRAAPATTPTAPTALGAASTLAAASSAAATAAATAATAATALAAPAAAAALLLVDLAGSERREDVTPTLSRPDLSGEMAKALLAETKATNLSLATLKECVRLQRQAELEAAGSSVANGTSVPSMRPVHVPWRRSKLTRILKPYMEGSLYCSGGEGGAGEGGVSEGGVGEGGRCCVIAHVHPLRSQGKHTANTLEFVASLFGQSRAQRERAAFSSVEAWSAARVVQWVNELDGGRLAHLAPCFTGMSGKTLSTEWLGHVIKRVRAQGGSEEDAHQIYDTFRALHAASKRRGGLGGVGSTTAVVSSMESWSERPPEPLPEPLPEPPPVRPQGAI